MKRICIDQNDDGTVMVGEMPAEMVERMGDEYMEMGDMQPADNLDAALAMARDMLSPSEEMAEQEASGDMDRGFAKAGGPNLMDMMK